MVRKPISNERDLIEILVDKVTGETEYAILVEMNGNKVWLPKSQMEDWPDRGCGGSVLIKEWLAIEKELI